MISGGNGREAEAIFFFDNGQVIKEMLYVEFEAVLDGIVGIPECKNQLHQAAYVSIGSALRVQTVVLFTIEFDEEGHIPKSWDLPLRYFASQADIGPDLGEGAIKIMNASHVAETEYANHLWDCDKTLIEVLTSINDAVKRNKLCIYVGSGLSGSSAFGHGMGGGIGGAQFPMQSFGEQNFMATNMESALRYEHERDKTELVMAHANVLKKKADENVVLQQKNAEVERKIEVVADQSREQLNVIVDKYKGKIQSELTEQAVGLEEQIAELELKLHYAQENECLVHEDMKSLEEERDAYCTLAIETFLEQLSFKGIEFIVSHSGGLGTHALKLHQVHHYMESQTGFWATQCGVVEKVYLAWDEHYRNPVCQAGISTGCGCGTAVSRVGDVRDFVTGQSDMCYEHRLKRVDEYY